MVADHILKAWITGWAITRGVSAPIAEYDGYGVDVGWPQQLQRYVFAAPGDGFKLLANAVTEPWVFLKVCVAPEQVAPLLPSRWVIQQQRYMMVCNRPMAQSKFALPDEYVLQVSREDAVTVVRITMGEETIAIGRIVWVDGYAIYDRIETQPAHRRRGLASFIMHTLERIALDEGINKGILVATEQGKLLYEKLGWELYSFYTTAVIPGDK